MEMHTNSGKKPNCKRISTNCFDNDVTSILWNIISRERKNNIHNNGNNELYVFNQGVIYGLKIAISELNRKRNRKIAITS